MSSATDTAADPAADPVTRFVAGRDWRMLIGGEFVGASDGARTVTVDPSTGEPLAEVPSGTAADVERAVDSARRAQPAWERLGLDGRAACFAQFRAELGARREELAMLDALDCGNPVRAMRTDVSICLAYVDAYPRMAYGVQGRVYAASPGGLHYSASRPYGVVGRITAFNHPLMFAATRPLPALVMGNAVVVKVAPQTPLAALALAEMFAAAFPPGVVNILTGGVAPGEALVTHPAVKRLAFTGSTATGLAIQRAAAESGHVKHLSLELGGKNAMVVLPDVDVEAAVDGAVAGMNMNVCQGQSCGSNSRVLVHAAVHDEFVERMAARLAALRVLPASSEEADMGPLVSAEHLQRVRGHVEAGRSEGASLVTGAEAPQGVPGGGFFMSPTLFAGVTPRMRIAQEEIFGPVVSVLRWNDYDEMLELANGVELGLTASVWTRDLDLAHATAARLDAGYVWINDSSTHYVGTPFGGTKDSGLGREESEEELLSCLETKVVHTRLADPVTALARMVRPG